MEHDDFCVDVDQFRDEEPRGEISMLTSVNEDSSHVTLRHQGYDGRSDDETSSSFNRNTESQALDSIYRYAKKIKSFLGWEADREDSVRAERIEESVCRSEKQGYFLNVKEVDVSPDTEKSNKSEKLIKDREIDDSVDEIASDSISESDGTHSSRFDIENFSGQASETDDSKTLELSFISGNESDFDIEDGSLAYENNFDQNIFRSEVRITVPDYRSKGSSSTGNVMAQFNNSESDMLKYTEMDDSLVQDNNTEVGIILNDADDILQNELLSSSVKDKMYDECEKSGKLGENLMQSSNEPNTSDENGIVKHDKISDRDYNRENTADEEKTSDESTNQRLDGETNVNSEVVNNAIASYQNSNGELSKKNEQDNDGLDEGNDESQRGELSEKDNSHELEKSPSVNIDKHLTEHSSKVNKANDSVKSYVTLKASVHYEKEKRSQEYLNGDTYCEKQDFGRKENLLYENDTACGLGFFKPPWLQQFATPKMYVILYSIIGILHGSYYSYLIGTLSTLEKRFAFRSKISGAIMVADEATPLLLGVIIGYCAGRSHRPRMVAIGMLLSAGCCFCSSLPYFIYGPVQHLTIQNVGNHTGPAYCETGTGKNSCDLDDRPPTLPAVLFLVLGSFLKGFGNLAYYAIGLAYLDDNSDKKSTPIYLAVALALRLLGPLVGFLMSSAFLKFYEDPFDDPGYGPDDPRWIGAWWMGFFLQGVLLVIFTLPIALFPRRLPSQKKVDKFSSSATNKESVRETLTGLVLALKRLGKNPIFILMIINTTMKIFGHFGHSIMLPKYMENQFRLSAADASLFSGATSIFCVMLSTVLGGFLIWKFRPRIQLLLAGMVTSEIILCLGFLILMIPRCQPADMLHFGMNDDGLILDSVCNQNCDCSTTSFTPFCGPDGKTTYFSPCYAGCTQELATGMSSKKQMVFGNCSCVSVPSTLEPNSATITEGFCPDENCWSKTLAYLIILFVLLTISNTLTVAHTMILLRSVRPGDKSVALGTFETFICLFGFIPFPVTFGALVDSACLVWEESCGETGNCWFYDMEKYGYLLHGAAAIFCALSTMCLITLYCLSSRVRDLYVEDDEEDEYIDNIKLDTVSGSVTKL